MSELPEKLYAEQVLAALSMLGVKDRTDLLHVVVQREAVLVTYRTVKGRIVRLETATIEVHWPAPQGQEQ